MLISGTSMPSLNLSTVKRKVSRPFRRSLSSRAQSLLFVSETKAAEGMPLRLNLSAMKWACLMLTQKPIPLRSLSSGS